VRRREIHLVIHRLVNLPKFFVESTPGSEENSPIRLVGREFAPIYGLFFLMGIEMYLFSPLLPTIAQDFKVDTGTSSLVIVAYVFVYAIMGPVLGNVSDKTSRRAMICVGVAIFAIGTLASPIAPNFALLVCARAVTGLGGAIAGPSSWAYLAERAPDRIKGKIISFSASVYALGQVIGVPVGTFIASLIGWRNTFLLLGLLASGLVILLFQMIVPNRPTASFQTYSLLLPWQSPPIVYAFLATFTLQAARLGTYSYVGILFDTRFGLSLRDLGFVGLLVGVATMCGSIFTGWWFDRVVAARSSVHWIGIIITLSVTTFVMLAVLASNLIWSIIFLLIWSFFGAGFQVFVQTYIATSAPHLRATVIAWNNSLLHGGIAVGTLLLGLVPVGGGLFTSLAVFLGLVSAVCCAFIKQTELYTM
jgi:predicted MFS family arabinose efflux permease